MTKKFELNDLMLDLAVVSAVLLAPITSWILGWSLLSTVAIMLATLVPLRLYLQTLLHPPVSPLSRRNENVTAVITGGSMGIGNELAKKFAQQGYNLVLVARKREPLEKLAEEISQSDNVRVEIVSLDLTEPNAPEMLYQQVKNLNMNVEVLVNNAGDGMNGYMVDLPLNEQAAILQLNAAVPFQLTRLFLPDMIARKKGYILQVASTAGFQPIPFMAVYAASKSFVVSLSESLFFELQGTGVTCSVVCPGPVDTERSQRPDLSDKALFKYLPVFAPKDVAEAAFDGLMKGRRMIVVGLVNKLMAVGAKFAPRSVVVLFSALSASKI